MTFNQLRVTAAVFVTLIASLSAGAALAADALVEFEVSADRQAPVGAVHQWLDKLRSAGVDRIRMGVLGSGNEVDITRSGTEAVPVYRVRAVLTRDNTLLVPGRRFTSSDIGALRDWVRELAEQGPPDERPRQTAFGLNVRQFEAVHNDLSKPVAFGTKGQPRYEVVQRVAEQLDLPVRWEADLRRELGEEPVGEELKGLSCGTALAYLLRYGGLCLIPQAQGTEPQYRVQPARSGTKIWPVGWAPKQPAPDVAPGLFEFLTVNVQNVPVTEVLGAVSQRIDLPVLYDHYSITRLGIEPEKTSVQAPDTRTTYSLLLKRVLFQARLKMELRVDEADRPFLWITTLKPAT